jgi:nucleoside-diphosphate-sugar epimerase
MHILVTSASSSLAQRLIAGLAAEHDVRATERPPVAEVAGLAVSPLGHDLSTNLLVRGVDVIVHCAEPLPDESAASYIDYVTRGTYNLLTAAGQEGVQRVLFLSTLDLMTPYPPDYVVTERWRPLPSTEARVLGKHLGEMVCREFARDFKLPGLALRIGTIVDGAARADTALLPDDLLQAVKQALSAQTPRWGVMHIQGEFDGARFPLREARRWLGFTPNQPSTATGQGVGA